MRVLILWIAGIIFLGSCSPKFAKFEMDQAKGKLPMKIKFTNLSKDADRYEWKFGDGSVSTEKNPEHYFTKSGSYYVSLKAFKGNKMNEIKKSIDLIPPEGCFIVIETTLGNMLVKLYDETPQHRDNFIKLAEQNYFDDLLFHRVINGFMIQGGDPNSKNANPGVPLGGGGPGYTIPAEFNKNLFHKKGALAAARTGDQVNPQKQSSGSQFYIVQGNIQNEGGLSRIEDQKGYKYTPEQKNLYMQVGGTPFLDMEYTVFGEVVEGLDIIDKIANVKTERGDRPTENVSMKIKPVH